MKIRLLALITTSLVVLSTAQSANAECDKAADPFCGLKSEMTKSFTRFFSDPNFPPLAKMRAFGENSLKSEVLDKGDELVIQIDLPGIDKDDVELNLYETYLQISAKREQKKLKKGENYQVSEIKYGNFSRTINFPSKVDIEDAESEYKNGVLEITVPKVEPTKPKYRKLDI